MRPALAGTRDRAMTAAFLGLSLALAFGQRPGWAATDTKIDLHVDPARFLGQVASVWTPTTDLGNVHSSQYSGYLWPMGPFYAVLHGLGISPWVVQRLWLGLMLGLAAWGALRLLDVLVGRPRGLVHAVAAAFYLANPFVVVYTTRTSLVLLGYAALPWLLIATHRGVRASGRWRDWRGWWWAAAFGLVLTSTGGGVNAALVGWIVFGPLVLLVYEPASGAVAWRSSLRFALQALLLGLLASLWWIVPVLAHVRYGIDFLKYTEQPSTIWNTNSASESLRLMGFWNSYGGVGFGTLRPLFSDAGTLLFNPLVVGASLLVPAVAAAGYVRRTRGGYAPFYLLLLVVGAIIMVAGFPNGTPLRSAMTWVYHRVFVLRFMRTTYKAGPITALGLAGLLGLAAGGVAAWVRRRGRSARASLVLAAVPFGALIVLAALPLFTGRAIDRQFQWKRIPPAWVSAGRDLDRTLPANTRALVLPGQIFAFYRWGGTGDAILPRLTDRPVAVRYETPYSDLRAADLLNTVDDLVQQRRAVPGQLGPLLSLMGVGAVITGTDDDTARSGAIDPAAAAGVLRSALPVPVAQTYGPLRTLPAAPGDIGPAGRLPQIRRYDLVPARGIVHLDSPARPTIVDGSARGVADLAAFGAPPAGAPLLYAADLPTPRLRAAAARGADIFITDANRRAVYVPEFAQQNQGAPLAADQPLPDETAMINPFETAGPDAETVSVLLGAASLTARQFAGEQQHPETAPFAAFDGDPATAWVPDRQLSLSDAALQLRFSRPRDVPYIDVLPLDDAHGIVRQVDVNGLRHAVGPGWTRIPLGLHRAAGLQIAVAQVNGIRVPPGSHGGLREIRVPGLHLREALRPPVIAERALAGTDLRHSALTFEFERQAGDDPFRRNLGAAASVPGGPQRSGDAERALDRFVFAPAARTYTARAWVYPDPAAPDSALDRLAGTRGGASFSSSGRFQDAFAFRASSAFARGAPGWVGVWAPDAGLVPWLAWRTTRPVTLSRLTLAPSALAVRRPTRVRISWPGGATGPLPVSANGGVSLPAPVRTRSARITILAAEFPPAATAAQRQAAAVGIGGVRAPGLPVLAPARAGALHARCGSVAVTLGGRRVPLRPEGTLAQLAAGLPLPARSCGPPAPLAGGLREIRALPGTFSVDLLQLRSAAPLGAPPSVPAGRLLAGGRVGTSSVDGVRVRLARPAWLVLGESYDAGWRATCDGRSLGAPQPVDVYANGWLAPAGCRQVSFNFAPQHSANLSYAVSALVCLLLALFVLAGARRLGTPRRPSAALAMPPAFEPVPASRRPARALGFALALAVLLALFFALRVGAVAFPFLAVILWRRTPPRTLAGVATFLLAVVVPVLYLVEAPPDQGGFDFSYSIDLIAAHWVAVGAIVLLGLAAIGDIALGRRRGRAQAASIQANSTPSAAYSSQS